MTVGLFQSLIIVLSICQGRQQASYYHASDIGPPSAGFAGLSVWKNMSRLEYFAIKTAFSMSQKPQRRHCPLGCSIQFP